MYTLYSTECIVLGSVDSGEANRYISLFTKDMGLVHAVAKSVREEKSKLRYALQDFSVTLATLVRGREVWRITGAEELYSIHKSIADDTEKLFVTTRILQLLKRLVHGEERNDYLFDTLRHGIEFIRKNDIDKEGSKNFECLLVLRTLYSLGYIARNNTFETLLTSTEVNEEILNNISLLRKEVIFSINQALRGAHL